MIPVDFKRKKRIGRTHHFLRSVWNGFLSLFKRQVSKIFDEMEVLGTVVLNQYVTVSLIKKQNKALIHITGMDEQQVLLPLETFMQMKKAKLNTLAPYLQKKVTISYYTDKVVQADFKNKTFVKHSKENVREEMIPAKNASFFVDKNSYIQATWASNINDFVIVIYHLSKIQKVLGYPGVVLKKETWEKVQNAVDSLTNDQSMEKIYRVIPLELTKLKASSGSNDNGCA